MSQGLIQGSMREAPLPDIIQLVSQGGKTGCFHVLEDPKRAKIYLKGGRIVHAVTNECEGLDALYQVALWLDGTLPFRGGRRPGRDHHHQAQPVHPDGNASADGRMAGHQPEDRLAGPVSLLHPSARASRPRACIPGKPGCWRLLTGYYTVEELAALQGKPVLSIAKDLYGLVMAGHVVLRGCAAAGARTWPRRSPRPRTSPGRCPRCPNPGPCPRCPNPCCCPRCPNRCPCRSTWPNPGRCRPRPRPRPGPSRPP